MATLKEIAQMSMDMFYRDYKSDDQFFDLQHFAFLAIGAYVDLVNKEGIVNKALNRQATGFSTIELSPDWLIAEKVKIEKKDNVNIGKLKYKAFSWDYDAMANGIYRVVTDPSMPCSELQKISQRDLQYACLLPANSQGMFLVLGSDCIQVLCNIPEVTVYYVPLPSIDNMDLPIGEDKQNEILRAVKELMQDPSGMIVDKSNDSNPNAVPAGELNPTIIK